LYRLDAGLSIPTVVGLGLGDGCTWPGAAIGLGSHPDLRVAARKAILELGQTGPTLCQLVQSGEQRVPAQREDVRHLLDHALYYVPRERAGAFDALRSGVEDRAWLSGEGEPAGVTLDSLVARVTAGGVRIATVDVTPPDVARSPFRVVRAVGMDMQGMSYGWGLERLANPRLHALCPGPLNPYPHPLC
jgi:ribosomal protein S12 methylthiotransferase accessory factor